MHRRIFATTWAAAALAAAGSTVGAVPGPAGATAGPGDGPAAELIVGVYAGTDGGASCGSALDYAEAGPGAPVTYCYTLFNTGVVPLASITVGDPTLGATPTLVAAESTPLAPGHSARWFVETVPPADDADGVIDDAYLSVVSASAVPADGNGAAIEGADPVTASSEAVVYPPEIAPVASMTVSTTVYAGNDGGAGCPAGEAVTIEEGAPLTWCHQVTNTGTTYLDAVTIAGSAELGATGSLQLVSGGPLPLAPGASAVFHLDGVAPAQGMQEIAAAATVSATAVDEAGAALAGIAPATGTGSAALDVTVAPEAAPVKPAPVGPAPRLETPARADVTPPRQLAYTGWDTWLLAGAGAVLVAAGWFLVELASGPRRNGPSPARPVLRPLPVRARRLIHSGRTRTTSPGTGS